jgi:hypothetical protein
VSLPVIGNSRAREDVTAVPIRVEGVMECEDLAIDVVEVDVVAVEGETDVVDETEVVVEVLVEDVLVVLGSGLHVKSPVVVGLVPKNGPFAVTTTCLNPTPIRSVTSTFALCGSVAP